MAEPFYHGMVRQIIVSFGNMFSQIYIERKLGDSVNGPTVQTLHVPLAYAPKEKWLTRLEQDPNLDKRTYVSLPRLSFEITGYSYDPSRKLQSMGRVECGAGGTKKSYVRSPVPYNMNINLYAISNNQEDGLQIIEQILPIFTPEYTLAIKSLPGLGVIQDVPIILNSVSLQDDYQGAFTAPRFVLHTLSFTLKMNMFGPIVSQGVISTVKANATLANYTGTADVSTGEMLVDSWIEDF